MTSADEKPVPPLFALHEHSSPVLCCDFYPSQTYDRAQSSWFLSGDVEGTVILWDLLTRRPLVTFSVLDEARRQLVSGSHSDAAGNDKRNASDEEVAREDAEMNITFDALGPHSKSILSVGFVPLDPSKTSQNNCLAASTRGIAAQNAAAERTLVKASANRSAVELASPATGSRLPQPQRQRFRLTRRIATCSPSEQEEANAPNGDGKQQQQQSRASLADICFYTHCRDQRVYIWYLTSAAGATSSQSPRLRLMAALTAPQHGFCPAESITTVEAGLTKTFLVVPHDAHGVVTVWKLQWNHSHKPTDVDDAAADCNSASSQIASELPSDEEVGVEVHTTGMNPMDALIARAAAEERRTKKRSMSESGQAARKDSEAHVAPHPVVKGMDRVSFLCFVAPFATTTSCGFSIQRLCSFSTCQRFKGGTIMRMTLCRDAQHLAVAFESGHVVLARYRSSHEAGGTARETAGVVGPNAPLPREATPSGGFVRCAVRAFAESALACWWSGSRMLACSAEGGIHCYEVSSASVDGSSDAGSLTGDKALELQLLWSVALRKGIGSVCLQANLVIAGCWDSTLRLYDARDGRLVSILSYQKDTINDVRIAPSTIARVAAFGFDARQPRSYAALPEQPAVTPTADSDPAGVCGTPPGPHVGQVATTRSSSAALQTVGNCVEAEEELVYLFASASKDGSVALWRVDMQLVAERAAARLLPTTTTSI